MKLLTKELEKKLPALGSTRNVADPMVIAHFFNPTGTGDWYIIEGGYDEGEYLMYGLCDLGFPEVGYVMLSELESLTVRFGLGIERETHWTPKPLSEVRK